MFRSFYNLFVWLFDALIRLNFMHFCWICFLFLVLVHYYAAKLILLAFERAVYSLLLLLHQSLPVQPTNDVPFDRVWRSGNPVDRTRSSRVPVVRAVPAPAHTPRTMAVQQRWAVVWCWYDFHGFKDSGLSRCSDSCGTLSLTLSYFEISSM